MPQHIEVIKVISKRNIVTELKTIAKIPLPCRVFVCIDVLITGVGGEIVYTQYCCCDFDWTLVFLNKELY